MVYWRMGWFRKDMVPMVFQPSLEFRERAWYLRESPSQIRKAAMQLHIDRIFENPRWVDFVPFNRQYRPEILQTAHLVTVVNECCQKPGVVTQEQIDASDNGTVACPCCGRWSPFRVLEQAIQTESAAGQTEEAKGGMHLC